MSGGDFAHAQRTDANGHAFTSRHQSTGRAWTCQTAPGGAAKCSWMHGAGNLLCLAGTTSPTWKSLARDSDDGFATGRSCTYELHDTRARLARRSRGHHDRIALLALISPSFLRPLGTSLTAASPGKSLLDFAAEPFMFPFAGSHHQIALEPFSCAGTFP